MASPAPLTAYVEKTALPGAKASQYLSPIETNRRGEVTGITLSVPVFSERNAFLVVKLGGALARDLARAASEKPEGQREQFIREWIKQNQLAIYDKYVESGGKSRRFQYNVVPITGLNILEVTPRRTETKAPAITAATPRRVEEPKTVPEPKRRGLVVEEEKKPAPKVTESKPPVAQPYEVKKPEPLPELAPLVRPPARAALPPLPKEIRKGNGSRANPYVVEPSVGRENSGTGATAVDISMPFQIEDLGTIHFKVRFTISQLKSDTVGKTTANLNFVCTAGINRFAAELGKEADHTAIRDAMRALTRQMYSVRESAAKADPDIAKYLGMTR